MKFITKWIYLFTGETLNREHSQTASQIYSEDSLDIDSTTNKQCRSDKHSCSNNNEYCKGSIILASNLTNEHYVSSSDTYHTAEESCGTAYNALSDVPSDVPSEASYISDQTSYMQVKLDLNKCINLFHNKHLDKEHETCEECSNVSTTSSKMKEAGPCYLNTGKTWRMQYDLVDGYLCYIVKFIERHGCIKIRD